MPEIRVGTWNMHNSFGGERYRSALEVIKQMDADVLFLGETALLGSQTTDDFLAATEAMQDELGYQQHSQSGYYPPYPAGYSLEQRSIEKRDRPNQHLMSMWARDSVSTSGAVQFVPFGNRYGAKITLENSLRIIGFHPDDQGNLTRVAATRELAAYLTGQTGKIEQPTIVMGDTNDDRKWLLNSAHRMLFHHLQPEHYNPKASKFSKLISTAARMSEMGAGLSIETLESAGLIDADQDNHPTCGIRQLSNINFLRLDRIMGAGVEFRNFRRHDRGTISDHSPLTAAARY